VRYGAFLSYSHEDENLARWLLRRLESYRVPARLVGAQGRFGPIPARLGAVFRDRDELPTAGDLSTTIQGALQDSAALVVLCSPASAQSRWVNAEIAAFRALGRSDRVLCFIVGGDPASREPGTACFAPAARAPDAPGAPDREPLAADARKQGDGRERAFIKLVAGLLGVGYDDLAQREAQRRTRRFAAVTAASLAITGFALVLAAMAYVARNDAERRRAQAENILDFMLGDLRKNLATVGRLDLMRSVDDKATQYFATLDPRDLSDRSLEAQARSLTGIGQVRLDEGKHEAALTAFREAHTRSTLLYQREPKNGQRLFDLAQAEYWIGYVAFQQGRHDEAGKWFTRYRDSAIRLAAMDAGNFDWQKEMAYGHQNLAVLDESLGRYPEAERSMRAQLALYRRWVEKRPGDFDLRFEAANAASWLGSLALRQSRFAEAETFFVEQAAAMRRNVGEDPRNARWKEVLVDALLLLADAQAQRGRRTEAIASVAQAEPVAAALAAQDPSNNYWRLNLGRVRWWEGLFESDSRPTTAEIRVAESARLLIDANLAEPKNERILSWLVRARNLQAQLALRRGDTAAASAHVGSARALLEPAWKAEPTETLRVWYARMRNLEGEIADQRGDRAAAVAAWEQARSLLLAEAEPEIPFSRLDPLVRVLLHLGDASAAAPLQQRLAQAGFVPLQPFPAGGGAGNR
jgi:hypothetical protein